MAQCCSNWTSSCCQRRGACITHLAVSTRTSVLKLIWQTAADLSARAVREPRGRVRKDPVRIRECADQQAVGQLPGLGHGPPCGCFKPPHDAEAARVPKLQGAARGSSREGRTTGGAYHLIAADSSMSEYAGLRSCSSPILERRSNS
eukprot:6211316-Pleurochrysis_carterae.AAC.6